MENINKIDDFLNQTGVCYLATATDGKPHCRPIGFHLLRGEYIYFIISNNKEPEIIGLRKTPGMTSVEVFKPIFRDWVAPGKSNPYFSGSNRY